MLTAVAGDQGWPDVVAGISARFSKFAFVLFCYITKHLMTGLLGTVNSAKCLSQDLWEKRYLVCMSLVCRSLHSVGTTIN